jgi:hypothetical protein
MCGFFSPIVFLAVAHDDAPSSFFCLINGHIMKHPVRSPHVPGHFERETLQKWVSNNGFAFFPFVSSFLYMLS